MFSMLPGNMLHNVAATNRTVKHDVMKYQRDLMPNTWCLKCFCSWLPLTPSLVQSLDCRRWRYATSLALVTAAEPAQQQLMHNERNSRHGMQYKCNSATHTTVVGRRFLS